MSADLTSLSEDSGWEVGVAGDSGRVEGDGVRQHVADAIDEIALARAMFVHDVHDDLCSRAGGLTREAWAEASLVVRRNFVVQRDCAAIRSTPPCAG